MRAPDIGQHQRLFSLYERRALDGVRHGVFRVKIGSDEIVEPFVDVEGRKVANFGTCSYMGLNTDQRLKDAAVDAIQRVGVIYASSVAFSALDMYATLETLLSEMAGGTAVVTPTVTHAHLSALPVLVGPDDAVLVDAQAHASLHLALQILAAEGVRAVPLPHNNTEAIERAVAEACSTHRIVWYLADGVYSMLGDLAPFGLLEDLLGAHDNLRLYIDDAHGFSWFGRHGRGFARDVLAHDPRIMVTVSLGKSFGGGGGAFITSDTETAERVRLLGSPMIFGGPLQVAELAVGIESAKIHLSPEGDERRAELARRIDLVRSVSGEVGLPVSHDERTPIWHVPVGRHDQLVEIVRRLLDAGFLANPVSFPAVPISETGIRFTQTLHHDDELLVRFLDTFARILRDVRGSSGEDLTIDLRRE